MKGAFQVGTMFGIPVKIHWSFFLLPAWAVGSSIYNGMNLHSAGWFLAYILTLFLCVLLHEFGHILMARRFGVGTQDVILTPIGGMARLHRMPEKPKNEFAVSIAGPLVNVGIAALLSPVLFLTPMKDIVPVLDDIELLFAGPEFFLRILILANLMLVGFNLLPAFPLDGGRILRAGLAFKLGRRRGTRIAAIIGKIMAVGLFGLGWYLSAPSFVLIGVFIFVMASMEYRAIANEAVLQNTTVSEVVNYDFTKVYETTPMSEVLRQYSLGLSKDFIVLTDNGYPLGMLSQKEINSSLHSDDLEALAGKYFAPMPGYLRPDMHLDVAETIIKRSKKTLLPVLEGEQVIGSLSLKSIKHYMLFKRRLMSWHRLRR